MALFKSKLMVQLNLNTQQQQQNENTFSIYVHRVTYTQNLHLYRYSTCTHAQLYGKQTILVQFDKKKKKIEIFFSQINHCTARFLHFFCFKKQRKRERESERA